jgi:hypothetical protein
MGFFLAPFLGAILIAILFKNLRQAVLKALGWSDKPIVLEGRIGAILFLICANVMAAIDCWYPIYLCKYHAAPDDRYGMAAAFGIPFWFLGAGISAWAVFQLIRAVFKAGRSSANVLYVISAGLLALGGFSPLLILGWRIVIFTQRDF